MQAMTSLSLCPSVVTCLPIQFYFLTRSQRFRCGKSPDTRLDFNPSMPTQGRVAAGLSSRHPLLWWGVNSTLFGKHSLDQHSGPHGI
jgi:hypothetical protein